MNSRRAGTKSPSFLSTFTSPKCYGPAQWLTDRRCLINICWETLNHVTPLLINPTDLPLRLKTTHNENLTVTYKAPTPSFHIDNSKLIFLKDNSTQVILFALMPAKFLSQDLCMCRAFLWTLFLHGSSFPSPLPFPSPMYSLSPFLALLILYIPLLNECTPAWWFTSVILAIWEAEIKRTKTQSARETTRPSSLK
jgi:hypothetical protein